MFTQPSAQSMLETTTVGDTAVVRLHGDIDIDVAQRLGDAAAGLVRSGARNIVIDCADVSYLDSTGLRVLVALAELVHEQSGAVTIRRPRPLVHRVLEVTALTSILIVDDPVLVL